MNHCGGHNCATALVGGQRRILWTVLLLNGSMFLVILVAALYGKSSALLADSLDNFGDALTYGLSLYAVSKSAAVKAKVALFKGGLISLAACGVAGHITYRALAQNIPVFEVMGVFSLLGLAANSLCLYLLWRYRHDDINMNSVWECSRNDVAANLAVLLAAGGVWLTNSGWPDILIAIAMLLLLVRSSTRVISSAMVELRQAT